MVGIQSYRSCLAFVVMLSAGASALAQEAAWPERPIRLIVNTAAGGAADTTSRPSFMNRRKDSCTSAVVSR
jgi:tripartite-type tricarboxylate transporter receptor subunit TctC